MHQVTRWTWFCNLQVAVSKTCSTMLRIITKRLLTIILERSSSKFSLESLKNLTDQRLPQGNFFFPVHALNSCRADSSLTTYQFMNLIMSFCNPKSSFSIGTDGCNQLWGQKTVHEKTKISLGFTGGNSHRTKSFAMILYFQSRSGQQTTREVLFWWQVLRRPINIISWVIAELGAKNSRDEK